MNDDELKESVVGFDALYRSMDVCKHNVMWKASTSRYVLNAIEETLKLERQLKAETYKPKPLREFTITHPKKRDIVSIAFRDRVYQRSLNDNVLYPYMTKQFINENFACQTGKGTDKARDYFNKSLRRAYMLYGTDFYVLQCDIKGYYPNMRHSVAEAAFKTKLPTAAYDMALDILHNQYGGDTGYNPGSQMIQIAGISVLSPMDHYIKEKLHIKLYFRYMDDFILIHQSKDYLYKCKDMLDDYLSDFGFKLNSIKTNVIAATDEIMVLGFKYHVTSSGKVIRVVNPQNVRGERKKLRRMVRLAKAGRITKAKVDDCFRAWKAHAAKGNSFKLMQRMDAYYKGLW